MRDYEGGQTELAYYLQEAEIIARKWNVDELIIVGDTNSCGITDDNVAKVGLKTRKSIFTEKGFEESSTAVEPTTFKPEDKKFVPRRLDRVFTKSLTNKWQVLDFNTRIQHPPSHIKMEDLSDHALFVVGDITLSKV